MIPASAWFTLISTFILPPSTAAVFYPRLTEKGVMIFNDYGYPSCSGVEKAVNDFFDEKIETPIYLPTGQCVVIKV